MQAALQSLAEKLRRTHGLVCTTRLDPSVDRLKREVQQILFRAVRELLHNVVKHAEASRVNIAVDRKPGSLIIEVSDDGLGMDAHKNRELALDNSGFGLPSVQANLATVGGRLNVVSRLGKGTRAVIAVPMNTIH